MIEALLQAIVSGLLAGGIYGLVAMGIVIVYRSSGILDADFSGRIALVGLYPHNAAAFRGNWCGT